MLVVSFYNKCAICGTKYSVNAEPSIIKPKFCKECRQVSRRANSVATRFNNEVDYVYIKKLLSGDRCNYCGKFLKWEEKQIEHKTPLSRGGTNDNSNLCLSCAVCNRTKGKMTAEEFSEYRKFNSDAMDTRQKVLELLNQYELTRIIATVSYSTKREEYNPPIIRNISVRDKNGRLVGIRKTKLYGRIIKVTKTVTKEELTKYGEIYNTVCRLANEKMLKLNKTEKIISEEIVSSY